MSPADRDLMQRVQETIRAVSERSDDPGALSQVRAHVRGNEVTLTGTVSQQKAAQTLVDELQALPGLIRVRSELQVAGEETVSE